MIFPDKAVVYRHAGITDDLVGDAERISLCGPAEIVDSLRPILFAARVELVDRNHLARLRISQQIIVLEAPPGCRVAAESLALVVGIEAAARFHIDDSDFENIARLGTAHRDGAGANMDAEPFSATAPVDRGIYRTGAAAGDLLFVLGPHVHPFGARVPLDHAVLIL